MKIVYPQRSRVSVRLGCALVLALVANARTSFAQFGSAPSGQVVEAEITEIGPGIQPLYWQKLNGGGFVDAGEPISTSSGTNGTAHFATLFNDAGDLMYTFRSKTVGNAMGRLSANKEWQLFTAGNWSAAADTTASAVGHAFGLYTESKIFQHPDFNNGLLGFSRGSIRSGTRSFNQHGMTISYRFDGTKFEQYDQNANYDEFRNKSVISSWPHLMADFDYDQTTRTGILVSTTGLANFQSKEFLTAAQYRHDDTSHTWHRWNRPSTGEYGEPGFMWTGPGDWGPDASPDTTRASFIFENDMDWEAYQQDSPRVTHLHGTGDYFCSFTLSSHPVNQGLTFARYTEGTPPVWQWWDGSAFQSGEPYGFTTLTGSENFNNRRQFYWRDGLVVILNRLNTGELREIVFNTVSDTIASDQIILTGVASFTAGVTTQGVYQLYYTLDNHDIRRISKSNLGSSTPVSQVIYRETSMEINPLGVNYYQHPKRPVLFIGVITDAGERICAISPTSNYWSDEATIALDPIPGPQLLDASLWGFEKAVGNDAPGNTYGFGTPTSMGIDEDGYLYTGRYGNTAAIVHTPGNMTSEDNIAWGGHWDFFDFPGGADVDSARGKVYMTDFMAVGGQGGLATNSGVLIWPMAWRDQPIGYQTSPGGSGLPSFMSRAHHGQEMRGGLSWAADLAVDSDAGLLYVVDALNHRVRVYDIENLSTNTNPFGRSGLFESRIISSHLPVVQDLVTAMIDADLLSDGGPPGDDGGTSLTWVSQDVENEVVPFLMAHPDYALLDSSYDDQEFLRNVRQNWFARNERPDSLTTFGTYGTGPGEFRFPQGIDLDADGNIFVVDSENNRVQHWINNGDGTFSFDFAFGSLGRDAGEFFYPIALAVDNAYSEVHVTDPLNRRIQTFDLAGQFLYEWGSFESNNGVSDLGDSYSLACNHMGRLYVGVGSNVVTFRSQDEAPILMVTDPSPCDVLDFGSNLLTGSTSDDIAVDRVELNITAGNQVLVDVSNDVVAGAFAFSFDVPTLVPAGTSARIEVAAVDNIGQTDTLVFFVMVGGPGNGVDSDGDGLADNCDNCPNHSNADQLDCDDDGTGDVCEIATGEDEDCDGDGVPDSCELASGAELDCNQNGIPDVCENDCNGNGIPDDCDIVSGAANDCNENGVPDSCDIEAATSTDCDQNLIPDECELELNDCNNNGVHDACDIAFGTSTDCQPNGYPDECELVVAKIPLTSQPDSLFYSTLRDQVSGDVLISSTDGIGRIDSTGSYVPFLSSKNVSVAIGMNQDPATGDLILAGVGDGFAGIVGRMSLTGVETIVAMVAPSQYLTDALPLPNGDILACSTLTSEILRIASDGTVSVFASGAPLVAPFAICADTQSDGFIVGDGAGVFRLDAAGIVTTVTTDPSATNITGVAVSADGNTIFASRSESPGLIEIQSDNTIVPLLDAADLMQAYDVTADDDQRSYLVCGRSSEHARALRVVPGNDCNDNDIPDDCDLADGTLTDINEDGIPDQCQSIGGCCTDVFCEVLTSEQCAAQCGMYFGDGTTCNVPCGSQAAGACCVDGVCVEEIYGPDSCECAGGKWEINLSGTGCAGVDCTP